MSTLDSLSLEVERLTGKEIIPTVIDYKIYFSPLIVFVLLLIFSKSNIRDILWYTFLISALIIGGFYAYKYRRFF